MDISEVTRRNIIDYLLDREKNLKGLFYGRLGIIKFLKKIWDLPSMPSTDNRFQTAEEDVCQHMVNNNDWETSDLLIEYLDLLHCEDRIFIKFLETCLHPLVLNNEEQVLEILSKFNECLEPDGYRLVESSKISGRPVYKGERFDVSKGDFSEKEVYDVAFSYAGENREYVEKVARYLKDRNVNIFYDKFEEADLWGKDLTEYFDEVFRKKAQYCVMFISKYYAEKKWPTYEKQNALAKEIEQKEEYILPARFDNTEIPGLRSTIGYIDLTQKTPEEFAKMILKKLGKLK